MPEEIKLPDDLKVDLDEESEEKEDLEEEDFEEDEQTETSIEDLVADVPSNTQNIPMSTQFASRQIISEQPRRNISPVLEANIPINQQTNPNLEQDIQNETTSEPETAGQEAQAYEVGSDYYSSNYSSQSAEDYPEPGTIDPTLGQTFNPLQQGTFNPADTAWGGKKKEKNWDEHYKVEFKEAKRDRRRI